VSCVADGWAGVDMADLQVLERTVRHGRGVLAPTPLLDADTRLYQFEIDNPTASTQSWKGELTTTRSTGNIYEFACHEGRSG